jgi:cytochrome c2
MKMQKNIRLCIALMVGLGILPTLPAISAQQSQPDSKPAAQQPAKAQASTADASEGEKKFKQNCSRCHEAPQSFSPRISGTIVRHMRVRASLSEKDAREILRFLNPQ